MGILSHNLAAAADFAKNFWVTPIVKAAGTTESAVAQNALVLPYQAKILGVDVVSVQACSASAVDVQKGTTSILSATVTNSTVSGTKVSGTISDSDLPAGTPLNVVLTRGNADMVAFSVVVQFRPYLGGAERRAKSLAFTS